MGLVPLIATVFLVFSTGIRLLLFADTPKGSGLTFPLLAKAMGTGILFDLGTLSYLLIPFALYLVVVPKRVAAHRFHWVVAGFTFLLFAAFLIFDGVAEYLFFEEFGTRFNFIAVDYLVYTREVVGNIRESYPLLPIFSGIGVVALASVYLMRDRIRRSAGITYRGRYRTTGFLLLLPPLVSMAFLDIANASVSSNNFANELAQNGIYSLVAAFRNNELDFTRFYRTKPERQVLARLRTLVSESNNRFLDPNGERMTRRITDPGREKRLNVIVVMEESLSAEYLGVFGNDRKLTPNLDRLAGESIFFTRLYATGTRTVRGLEALTLSMPPLPGSSIVKRPGNDGFRSWGEIMKGKGYDTRFLYAGYGYFDNMKEFYAGNGFNVVDRADFGKDEITFANIWGVCDEDLFRKTIREAGRSHAAGRPFFHMVMTTSNHRPFTYPEGRIDIPSKTGRDGGVKYADYAVGMLIEASRREPWFSDTVFVIVADHSAGSAGKTDIPVKRYEIPLIVYAPGHFAPKRVDTLMSQIDVAPTVLGLLNMSYDTEFLGRDILKPSGLPHRAFLSTYQKLGFMTENRLLVLGPRKYAAEYEIDPESGAAKQIPLDDSLLDDMLAYYEGENHLYKHRLNRMR